MNSCISKDFSWEKQCSPVQPRRSKDNLKICDRRPHNSMISLDATSTFYISTNVECHCEAKNSRNSLTLRNNGAMDRKSETKLPPIGLDCEMVGVGEEKTSALARCSIVGYSGDVIFDAYVKPDKPITDFRTKWSGIRPKHMNRAIPFRSARRKVKRIIKNRILVGHALQFDLKVLKLKHRSDLIRDTSKHIPLRALAGFPRNSTPSLKRLTRELLKWEIQISEHSSVEDARAAMALYRKCDKQWEKEKGNGDQSYLGDAYWPNWTKVL